MTYLGIPIFICNGLHQWVWQYERSYWYNTVYWECTTAVQLMTVTNKCLKRESRGEELQQSSTERIKILLKAWQALSMARSTGETVTVPCFMLIAREKRSKCYVLTCFVSDTGIVCDCECSRVSVRVCVCERERKRGRKWSSASNKYASIGVRISIQRRRIYIQLLEAQQRRQ